MSPYSSQHQYYLSGAERSAIAEIEGTTNILKLVLKYTSMPFAAIAKFNDDEWVICSALDKGDFGLEQGDAFPLERTVCSEFLRAPEALLVPSLTQDSRFALRPIVNQLGIDSYAGVPIFLPNGDLYGALCALDTREAYFDDPDLAEVLSLFARLVGCILYACIEDQTVEPVASV
ncbi:GAF domain-containing protein [Pseudomonas phoenicis]|uniref:GAF domain-containing protein n=1 Tax=unclassified Pseudomonas TaxID=196821 RepID=UPI0039A05A97